MTFLRPKWMPKSSQNRAQELSKTLLEPGCRPNLFSEAFFEVFGGSRNLKNHAPAIARAHFLLKSQFAAGAPKSSPKASQNGAQKPSRRLPEGFKTSLKKGFDFSVNFKAFLVDFGGPRGGPRGFKKASKNDSKTALASKLAFSTPRSPPGAHFGALGPPFWSLRELIFEASAPSSGGTFAGFQKPQRLEHASFWNLLRPRAGHERPGTHGGRRCRACGAFQYIYIYVQRATCAEERRKTRP